MLWTSKLSISLLLLGVLGCSSNAGKQAGDGGGNARAGAASGGGGAGGLSGSGGAGASNGGSGTAAQSGGAGVSAGETAGTAGTGGGAGGSGGGAPAAGAGGSALGTGSNTTGGAGSGSNGPQGGAANGGAANGGAANGSGGTSGAAGDAVDAATMAKAMGFGANIGNTFDNTTAWETGWGEPAVTQAYVNGMASRGVKTVRVPVAWNTYAVNGVIDATKMARVKEVVGWIESAGMYSIVNIHWDGGWIDNDTDGNANKYELTDDVKTKFASYWTQIAAGFAAVGNKTIFEALNEESKFYVNGDTNQAPDYVALNTLNQLFVTTVRAQSGYNKSRALLIAGFTTDIDLTCVDSFSVPTDPAGAGKLFLSIHYYTPYTFCGLDTVESWGSPQTTWGSDSDQSTLDGLFTKLGSFSSQRHIPVILGEFGVTVGQSYPRDPASRSLWMETVVKASFSRGIVPVLWDTGSDISRTDGSFSTALQTAMTDVKQ